MRIAVDARELCGRPTGVGRYLSELLAEWCHDPRAAHHEWVLYAHARPQLPPGWQSEVRVLPGGGGSAWEQWVFSRALSALRPDVVFAPAYSAPLTAPAPTVLTLHDVSFFAHPEWFSSREGIRRRLLSGWSARRARVVLTDTAFSQREITRHIGIPQSRVRVIPLGIRLAEPASSASREPMILYVGSVFERRRPGQLISAFELVADQLPLAQLEIVGENRTRHPRIDLEARRHESRHRDRIHIRSYVDQATLAGLYARASVFAFLSEYEGFGLTPLEALAAGVPPVMLDTPVARETAGDAAHYVAASGGHQAVSAALITFLTDGAAREALLRRRHAVLEQYNWTTTAARTLAALEGGAVGQ